MSKKRAYRHTDAGHELRANKQSQRKSRAGQDTHPSGNYVRQAAPAAEGPDAEDLPARLRAGITLPRVTFMEKKRIAGEWL